MTREDEILDILHLLEEYQAEELFAKYHLLDKAERLLRVWTRSRQAKYNGRLTELNIAIRVETGITDPDDLAIARELIGEAYIERYYRETTDGAEFSDSS